MGEHGGLVPDEGVDEGSSASTQEGLAGHHEHDDDEGVLGAPGVGGPRGESSPTGPVDMEGDDARAARDATGTGQQLAEGEG